MTGDGMGSDVKTKAKTTGDREIGVENKGETLGNGIKTTRKHAKPQCF